MTDMLIMIFGCIFTTWYIGEYDRQKLRRQIDELKAERRKMCEDTGQPCAYCGSGMRYNGDNSWRCSCGASLGVDFAASSDVQVTHHHGPAGFYRAHEAGEQCDICIDVVVFDDALDRLRDSDIAGASGPEIHYKSEAYRHVKEMAARLVEHGPPTCHHAGRCLCNTELVAPPWLYRNLP